MNNTKLIRFALSIALFAIIGTGLSSCDFQTYDNNYRRPVVYHEQVYAPPVVYQERVCTPPPRVYEERVVIAPRPVYQERVVVAQPRYDRQERSYAQTAHYGNNNSVPVYTNDRGNYHRSYGPR